MATIYQISRTTLLAYNAGKRLFLGVLLIFSFACQTEFQTPDAVEKSFRKKFKIAQGIEWNWDNERYTVNFWAGDIRKKALFDASGQWLKTFVTLDTTAIQPCIREAIGADFPEYYIDIAKRIESNEEEIYFLQLKKAEQHSQNGTLRRYIDLVFDENCVLQENTQSQHITSTNP